jgi:hypothetical protein
MWEQKIPTFKVEAENPHILRWKQKITTPLFSIYQGMLSLAVTRSHWTLAHILMWKQKIATPLFSI